MKNILDPHNQSKDINTKIIAGIERLHTIFRAAIQQQAKHHQITPLQTQLLLFIAGHDNELCTVTLLAKEFVMTKATVSDSIRSLTEKGYIEKKEADGDSRLCVLVLTHLGMETVQSLYGLSAVFSPALKNLKSRELTTTWKTLVELIYAFQQQGLVTCRMCPACHFFQDNDGHYFCQLLNKHLSTKDIRLDCPDYKSH